MTSLSVFCGSSSGNNPDFISRAFKLGELLAEKKIKLVYGGAKIGLMGAIADGCISRGGNVTGVLPHFMSKKEIAHDNLTELILVDSMHQRKMMMHEISDGAIVLPGGYGTMDEFFELLTWLQLGLHNKPIGILNVDGFYNLLQKQIEWMFANDFIKENHLACVIFENESDTLLQKMETWKCPVETKWLNRGQE